MKERLLEFLKAENKSSAQFAEEIGVQASGISHILSGRNNPSLDFILKMLEKYQFLSTEWLLFGKGSMYKESKMQTLFDENSAFDRKDDEKLPEINFSKAKPGSATEKKVDSDEESHRTNKNSFSDVKKIVWFYDNNSFEEYFPRQ
jgi:transcriptional regulator with XRE-family HTH domain